MTTPAPDAARANRLLDEVLAEPAPDPAVVELVARRIAAADWVEDPADDVWWNSRVPKFRDDYLGFAEEIVRIVHASSAKGAS